MAKKLEVSEEGQQVLEWMYTKPAPLNKSTLTLGCEFEFVLSNDLTKGSGKRTENDHGSIEVAKALKAKRQEKECAGCKQKFLFELPVQVSTTGSNYGKWQVEIENSALPRNSELTCLGPRWDNLQFYPIEVKSRILHYDRTDYQKEEDERTNGHEHWIPFQKETMFVLEVIDKEFGLTKNAGPVGSNQYHAFITEQCGFHCHIGNGKGTPIPFNTVKKVYMMYVACEKHIDELVGTRAIAGSKLLTALKPDDLLGWTSAEQYMEKDAYNRPPSVYLIHAAQLRQQSALELEGLLHESIRYDLNREYPLTAPESKRAVHKAMFAHDASLWLDIINGATDISQIRSAIQWSDRSCALNLTHLPSQLPDPINKQFSDPSGKRMTVEFRQHAGTLVAEDALSFIEFAVKMVLKCHAYEDKNFESLMEPNSRIRKLDFTSLGLLSEIHVNKETRDFYDQQSKNQISALSDRLQREKENVSEAKAKESVKVANFALAQIEKHLKSIDHDSIKADIFKKLAAGGYGQFTPDNLNKLLPNVTADVRKRLTIGNLLPIKPPTQPTKPKYQGVFFQVQPEESGPISSKPPGSAPKVKFEEGHPGGESSVRYPVANGPERNLAPSKYSTQHVQSPDQRAGSRTQAYSHGRDTSQSGYTTGAERREAVWVDKPKLSSKHGQLSAPKELDARRQNPVPTNNSIRASRSHNPTGGRHEY